MLPPGGVSGPAGASLAGEPGRVAVGGGLIRRFFPTPYDWRRIGEYVVTALAVFFICERAGAITDNIWLSYTFNIVAFAGYAAYLVRREHIDLKAMLRSALRHRKPAAPAANADGDEPMNDNGQPTGNDHPGGNK